MARTIALIDDDLEDLEMLKSTILLIDETINCISFVYPEEAIRVITHELILAPDLIFTDINMPKVDGEKVVKALREEQQLKETKIIVLSTSINPESIYHFTKLGANHVFKKPLTVSEYNKLISDILYMN